MFLTLIKQKKKDFSLLMVSCDKVCLSLFLYLSNLSIYLSIYFSHNLFILVTCSFSSTNVEAFLRSFDVLMK